MKESCVKLVNDLRDTRLNILALANYIAGVDKSMSIAINEFQKAISADKDLKNADSRKASLVHLTTTDPAYLELEADLAEKTDEKSRLEIDQKYFSELLRVHLAFANDGN